ncbi:MAG: hypothetical protein EPN41_08420 [Candidimonas sp.]|nr:MAG: hypothetical protein EPN41_08420 [Candidimonas sp.]
MPKTDSRVKQSMPLGMRVRANEAYFYFACAPVPRAIFYLIGGKWSPQVRCVVHGGTMRTESGGMCDARRRILFLRNLRHEDRFIG